MDLTPEQEEAVKSWVQSRRSLAEIQELLEKELGLRVTYMEARFLVDDLNLQLASEGPEFPDPAKDLSQVAESPAPGQLRVSVDKVKRPGALISGSVTFSDGISAQWSVDSMGRLSLSAAGNPSYRPSAEDMESFQLELQKAFESGGVL